MRRAVKTLLVIVGPTGVGKTEVSLRVAEALGCPIVNADSRQVYREIPIGTAAPTAAEQARVKHYFVGCKSVAEDYNAGQYERDVMALLPRLFAAHETVVLTGGSMLYVDAVCKGLDEIPTVSAEVQQQVRGRAVAGQTHGIAPRGPAVGRAAQPCRNSVLLMHAQAAQKLSLCQLHPMLLVDCVPPKAALAYQRADFAPAFALIAAHIHGHIARDGAHILFRKALARIEQRAVLQQNRAVRGADGRAPGRAPVSYTHLTLPTICSV